MVTEKKSIIENAANDYKLGYATELLEQSLLKLKASEKEEFRSNAGKVISLMLESRLNEKDSQLEQTYKNLYGSNNTTDELNNINNLHKNALTLQETQFARNSNELNNKALEKNLENHSTVQIPKAISDDGLTKPQSKCTVQTSPTALLTSTPLPSTTAYMSQDLSNTNVSKSLSPPQNKAPSNPIIKLNSVKLRCKDTKSKLTTHEPDRRSYIENNQQNVSNTPTSNTTDKASKFTEGKQHICSSCNIKISQ